MASTTSPTDEEGPVVDMAAYGAKLAARRAELGYPELTRNAGTNRTASKRALLRAIADAGGKW